MLPNELVTPWKHIPLDNIFVQVKLDKLTENICTFSLSITLGHLIDFDFFYLLLHTNTFFVNFNK